jgi:DNA-binding transcriptional LysR family regulator
MDWSDLRFVLAVARERTLAAAGRKLRVDPTTAGRRVLAIEERLGVRLFDRTGDGYVLTPAGRIAADHAEKMEVIALSLEQQVAGSDSRIEGPVRITALDAVYDALIIPNLPRLMARHPGLELTLSSGFDTLDLSRREADVALRPAKPTEPDLVGRHLGRAAMAIYAAEGVEFGPTPPIVGLPRQREHMQFARYLGKLFPGSPVVTRANTERHIHLLVRAGLGVGLIDCFIGDADPGLRRVRAEPVDFYDIHAVFHMDLRSLPRVRAVLDFLSLVFTEQRSRIEGLLPHRSGPPA